MNLKRIKSRHALLPIAALFMMISRPGDVYAQSANIQHEALAIASTWPDSNYAPPRVGIFDYISQSLLLLFKFHQVFISDIDGPNCPMHPTCSNYAIKSVKEYGFLEGSLKAFDRLHRCSHDLKFYPLIEAAGRLSYEDPP